MNEKNIDKLDVFEVTKNIKNILSKCNDVLLVFLFGSVAKGFSAPYSDIDIAILFCHDVDFYRISSIKEDLSKRFNNITVDIVVLNNASPIIKMQALRNGTLLINKVPSVYNEFFVNTIIEYDDLKQIRKGVEENILKGRIYA